MPSGWVQTQPFGGASYNLNLDPYSVLDYQNINFGNYLANSFYFQANKRWNMVSVPVSVEDSAKQTLFPTALSLAYTFSGSGYESQETLAVGPAYWLKFSKDQYVFMVGEDIYCDTVAVRAGWNMIGSISAPVAVASIIAQPQEMTCSQFFGYNGGYFITDVIEPGKGYWVKVNQDGLLILSAPAINVTASAAKQSHKIRIVAINELPPPPPDNVIASLAGADKAISQFQLLPNYPNPFNPTTSIRYHLTNQSHVILKVFNVLGSEVTTLVNEIKQPGAYKVDWEAKGFSSGVYFYRLTVGRYIETKKMLLVR